MSARRRLAVIQSVGRVALVVTTTTIAFEWPLPIAVASVVVLAGLFVIVARLPHHPDKLPVDRTMLAGPAGAIYYASSFLLLLAGGWLLIGLFFAEDSRDLAAPFFTFVLVVLIGKWNLAVIRRRAARHAPSEPSATTSHP